MLYFYRNVNFFILKLKIYISKSWISCAKKKQKLDLTK